MKSRAFQRILRLAAPVFSTIVALASEPRVPARHWSLQPVIRPAAPQVDESQARNAIDAFVARKLADAGLALSPEASRAVLARRLHYVLTGLPPSAGQIAEFERSGDYDALAERLLGSAQYGEKWARHWLDVVRFAETHGFEMNQPRHNAWRYRDYVIGAFNVDLPYDRFVREQLAGDALGAGDATGFLVGGPWDQVKSPDPVLTANQRAEELHDIVSTAGTAFLGLTIGCARCHDHKFDPIPQADYYAVKAVFAGVEHGERERGDAQARALKTELAELRRDARALENALDELEPRARPGSASRTRLPVSARRNIDRIRPVEARKLRFTILKSSDAEPCLDELEAHTVDDRNAALASAGTKAAASGTYSGSELHKLEHINDGRHGNGRSWISSEIGRGWVQLEFSEPATLRKIIWGRDREEKFKDRLALEYEIAVLREENGGPIWEVIASSADRQAPGSSQAPSTPEAAPLLDRRKKILAEAAEIERELMVYAGRFNARPEPTHRLHRGDPMLKREPVQPGALGALSHAQWDTNCAGTKITDDQGRRLAFAHWVADPANPLTARVMVNRIWQQHFGQGIVSTPSDFGANGARPSHPELLDWLAAEFVESGWSVKHLQRLIVRSATFRQSSAHRAQAAAIDAESRLLWRFPPRRLEAEAIRDSILAASGSLDLRAGGPGFSFFEPNENYVRVYAPKIEWGPETSRRMVYGTIVRQRPDGVFGVFDCPDAGQIAPKRTSSTTPLQALNLLNSSFIVQQAGIMARRIDLDLGSGAGLEARVRRAFQLALQRAPAPTELKLSGELAESEGLAVLCRALLNANEFVYLF